MNSLFYFIWNPLYCIWYFRYDLTLLQGLDCISLELTELNFGPGNFSTLRSFFFSSLFGFFNTFKVISWNGKNIEIGKKDWTELYWWDWAELYCSDWTELYCSDWTENKKNHLRQRNVQSRLQNHTYFTKMHLNLFACHLIWTIIALRVLLIFVWA